MTFNRAFKELFHEILYEEGYKYIAKWGRFIKVYNDELIYSVGHRMIPAIYKGKKCFTITSGIRTIYFESIDKWVFESTEHDLQMYSPTLDWLQFAYDESDIYDVVKRACLQFDELVAPVFNAVNDLKSYIAYAKKYQINVLHYGDKFMMDSLVLILTDNHEDFEEQIQKASINDDEDFVRKCMYAYLIDPRDKVYNDRKLYKSSLEEAGRRKQENLETLHLLKAI